MNTTHKNLIVDAIAWLVTILFLVALVDAVAKGDERSEVARLAPEFAAESEVTAWDGSRADMVNAEYAFEVEWPEKWQQAIGQAVYYAIQHDRKPGIVLLRKRGVDVSRFIYRCQIVCAKLGIRLWVVDAKEE